MNRSCVRKPRESLRKDRLKPLGHTRQDRRNERPTRAVAVNPDLHLQACIFRWPPGGKTRLLGFPKGRRSGFHKNDAMQMSRAVGYRVHFGNPLGLCSCIASYVPHEGRQRPGRWSEARSISRPGRKLKSLMRTASASFALQQRAISPQSSISPGPASRNPPVPEPQGGAITQLESVLRDPRE